MSLFLCLFICGLFGYWLNNLYARQRHMVAESAAMMMMANALESYMSGKQGVSTPEKTEDSCTLYQSDIADFYWVESSVHLADGRRVVLRGGYSCADRA